MTYEKITGMMKNKDTVCKGSFNIYIDMFENALGVLVTDTFRTVFCGSSWISEIKVLLRI